MPSGIWTHGLLLAKQTFFQAELSVLSNYTFPILIFILFFYLQSILYHLFSTGWKGFEPSLSGLKVRCLSLTRPPAQFIIVILISSLSLLSKFLLFNAQAGNWTPVYGVTGHHTKPLYYLGNFYFYVRVNIIKLMLGTTGFEPVSLAPGCEVTAAYTTCQEVIYGDL